MCLSLPNAPMACKAKPKLLSWYKDAWRSHSCFIILVLLSSLHLCVLRPSVNRACSSAWEKRTQPSKTLPGFAALTLTAGHKGWERWQDLSHPGVGVTVATAPLSLMADKRPAERSSTRRFSAAHCGTNAQLSLPNAHVFRGSSAGPQEVTLWASPSSEGPRGT